MIVAGAVAIPSCGFTFAAFVATTDASGNRIEAGTVEIDDNDGGAALLSFAGVEPGALESGCITVTFTGSLASTVRLHGSTAGGGLDRYLDLKVTRGAYAPSDSGFRDCTNFQPDSTDYNGDGPGVVYAGTLRAFPGDYAGGLDDPPSGAPETWTMGEQHVYKLEVSLRHDPAASGLDATQAFTWEARNQ